MQDCKNELAALLKEERLSGATLLVLANKQDLAGALTEQEIREALDLDSIQAHHWAILTCSAVTGKKPSDRNGLDCERYSLPHIPFRM
ncbi:Arf-domain-containing protein, partial [Basidiobolus meristosporus CBS 931.73]